MAYAGRYNLLIIVNPQLLDPRDFQEIGNIILGKSDRISVYILSGYFPVEQVPTIDWSRPTFTIAINGMHTCVPKRGPVFHNYTIDKFEQIEILKRAGVPVPETAIPAEGVKFDPAIWGDHVIVKSRRNEGSSKGKSAYVTPTRFISEPDRLDDPVRSLLKSGDAMVQEFINTGPHPAENRVTTLLGRVISLFRGESSVTLPDLDPNSAATYIFDSKYKNEDAGAKRQRYLLNDPEIISFAPKVAKAFPTIPLLGIDVLKHKQTGRLYALEVNAGGNTWHFSSPLVTEGRKHLTREQRIAQFGAWDVAANVLIEKTLYYAR